MGSAASRADDGASDAGAADAASEAAVERRWRDLARLPCTNRGPAGFWSGRLDDDVLAFVLGDEGDDEDDDDDEGGEVHRAGKDQLEQVGRKYALRYTVDHPHLKKHLYAEGYMHALPRGAPALASPGATPPGAAAAAGGGDGGGAGVPGAAATTRAAIPESIVSMNPRHGNNMRKVPAPLRLRALVCAFREVNQDWLLRCFPEEDESVAPLRAMVERGEVWADLAYQVHAGQAVGEDDIGWHLDGPNSVLHLALSLRGRRGLHTTMLREGADKDAPDFSFERDVEHEVAWQTAGDVYISSPYAVKHGVEYPRCSFDDRIIAVQCRFLVLGGAAAAAAAGGGGSRRGDLYDSSGKLELSKAMVAVTASLQRAAAEGDIKCPTLDQVKTAAKTLAATATPAAEPSS